MTLRASIFVALLLAHGVAGADTKPVIRKLDGLIVMTPSPTQAPPPGLRLRTMVRPADRLWIAVDVPAHVPLEFADQKLDLLDPIASGGWVATYREGYDACSARGAHVNCRATVKIFDASKMERASVALHALMSRPDQLEVQDVRYDGRTLYFNEACQSYSKEAYGKCSALVAIDPVANKVLWRTGSLVSNNYFLIVGEHIVAAYGFMGEAASIRIIRRSDGKVLETQKLEGTNFEMTTSGDTLSVELYYTIGRANFRMSGFEGATPALMALPTTPPSPKEKPKPYDPPLIK